MQLIFPEYALECQKILENAGYEARFVGGCVRDGILNKTCNDIDITTNALPEDIISLFEHTIPTGIKHGTITVIIDSKNIEVTTYRTEGKYKDHRHPEEVAFTSDIAQDLSRRDFTINAMAYDNNSGLIDLFEGLADIKRRLIRCVGRAETRFEEDALRILRAYRFASVLNFDIDDQIIVAAKKLKHLINEISGERILVELEKLAKGEKPQVFEEFLNLGSLSHFGIHRAACSIALLDKVTDKSYRLPLFIALTCHDTEIIKEKLKPNNILYKQLLFLDCINNYPTPTTRQAIKSFLLKFGEDNFKLYINYLRLSDTDTADKITDIYREVITKGEPYLINHLAINGNDVKKHGYSGEEIGYVLEQCADFVIANPDKNRPEILLEKIKK